jgi:FkbM family methyltransferase
LKALLLKFFPGLYDRPITFTLKDGFYLRILEFMALHRYEEIFIHRCYDVELGGLSEPVIVDVGANTGMFLLRAKQLWPRSFVVCYEPYQTNYAELEMTIRKNHLNRVMLFMKGVGGTARVTQLHIHKTNSGGHSIYAIPQSDCSVDIELDDLKSVLVQTPDGRCDLLKLDCEGAEYEILLSIDDKVSDCLPKIIFETDPGPKLESVRSHLEAQGYQVEFRKGLWYATRQSGSNRRRGFQ